MSSRKPLILVVDDDPSFRRLLKRDLGLEGYQVITASDGEAGLQLIEDEDPALVILDIKIPGVDGFEVCKRAREFSKVPIMMVTAKEKLEDVAHGLDAGADDYLVKPFHVEELLDRVKVFLR